MSMLTKFLVANSFSRLVFSHLTGKKFDLILMTGWRFLFLHSYLYYSLQLDNFNMIPLVVFCAYLN